MFQRGGFLTVFLITRFRHWNSRISTSRNIAKMFTLGVMLPWHNNCCRKFPWRYRKPSSGLVVGFGVIRQAGSMKCVQKLFLAVCHYDGPWYHAILGPMKTTLLICLTPIFNINRATTSHHDIVPSVNAPLCSRKHQTRGYINTWWSSRCETERLGCRDPTSRTFTRTTSRLLRRLWRLKGWPAGLLQVTVSSPWVPWLFSRCNC